MHACSLLGRTVKASTRQLLCEPARAIRPPQQLGAATFLRARPRNTIQLAAKRVEIRPPLPQLLLSAVDADFEHVQCLLRAVVFLPADALDIEREPSR